MIRSFKRIKEMKLCSVSRTLILCTLIVFSIVQDSGARKIVTTSGRDFQPKEVFSDLKQIVPEGLVSNILQIEGSDLEINNKPLRKDDDEDDHKNHVKEEDDEEDHEKLKKRKYIREEEEEEEDNNSGQKEFDRNHMDPELNVFFTPNDLKIGKKMPIYFYNKDSSTSPKFLSKEESTKIPFSSKHLSSLLKFFSIPKHSPQAKAMKYTLQQCEIEAMEGETKFCATSLESLLDFARDLFGSSANFKVLTTNRLTNSTAPLQNYTVTEVKVISVPNVIGCHPMPYPYAVFYCHSQKSDTNLYEVMVESENGGRVEAAAICHMDTSKWDPDHVSFRVLNVQPGKSPVCHFFPPDNLVWVPLPLAS